MEIIRLSRYVFPLSNLSRVSCKGLGVNITLPFFLSLIFAGADKALWSFNMLLVTRPNGGNYYNMKFIFSILLLISTCLQAQTIDVTTFGVQPNSFADATEAVQQAIEACRNQSHSEIELPKSLRNIIYNFWKVWRTYPGVGSLKLNFPKVFNSFYPLMMSNFWKV